MKFELNLKNSQINEKIFSKAKYLKRFKDINNSLHSGKEDWTTWVDYPSKNINKLKQVKDIANKITKDGDVLIHENMHDPFIAKYYDKENNQIECHCGLSTMNYNFSEKPYTETELNVIPAEFKRKQNFYDHMRKAGYYWDFKNNKLLHYGKWMYVKMDTMYEWFYKVKELSFLNREQLLTDFITFIKEKSGENII